MPVLPVAELSKLGAGAVESLEASAAINYLSALTTLFGASTSGSGEESAAPFNLSTIAIKHGATASVKSTKAYQTVAPANEAKAKMIDWLESKQLGKRRIQYKLRDWLFSRQRYWGEPFPIVHLADGSLARIPDDQLPVLLPAIKERKSAEFGKPPLSQADDDWLLVTLPDGRTGVRETNTMPQWAGSCWYYLRYVDPQNSQEPWSAAAEQYWLPVDLYVGGAEHAVLHLLYARFWHKVLYDRGVITTREPFQKLVNQGLILGEDGERGGLQVVEA